MHKNLKGCGTALVTPFLSDGSIDFASYKHLVRLQCEADVDFLVPCGATGEELSLSNPEYQEVVRATIEVSAGRYPVVASICESNTHKACAKAREVFALGADALLVVSPPYLKPTQDGIYCHFKAVAESTPLPVILYDVPGRTATHILPRIILKLAELPSIVGIKDASGNLIDSATIASHAPDTFSVLSGQDCLTLPLMAVGATGVISVAANVAPRQIAAAVKLSLENNHNGAREIYRKMWPFLAEIASEVSPIPIKCALSLMGRIEEYYRLPLLPLSSDRRERLRQALLVCGLLDSEPQKAPVQALDSMVDC